MATERRNLAADRQQGARQNPFAAAPWLFDLASDAGNGEAAVHLPLIYATRLRVEHEAYASALARFATLADLGNVFQAEVVDGATALFRVEEREELRRACFEALSTGPGLALAVDRKSVLRRGLPNACLTAEREFLEHRAVSARALTRLFENLADAIALNLLNPFAETMFVTARRLFASSELFDDLVDSVQSASGFSYLQFFHARLGDLATRAANGDLVDDDCAQFCWEVGFLAGAGSEETDYDSPEATARLVGAAISCRGVEVQQHRIHTEPLDVGNSDPVGRLLRSENLLERVVGLLAVLQLHEDVRHYWQSRSCRLFRLLATDGGVYDHHRPLDGYETG